MSIAIHSPLVKSRMLPSCLLALGMIAMSASARATYQGANNIIVADFEGDDYGAWKTTGTAFGKGPAHGTLPGQMMVEGFLGRGLVNSFNGGDDSKGRLTSPTFKLERKFLTFLIGGGGWANETCMNLMVDGKVVRTATGPNTLQGGSERLMASAWDVAEFLGKDVVIEIVDEHSGGWGHINVDQIVQTNDKEAIPLAAIPKPPASVIFRNVHVNADFIQFPLVRRERSGQQGVERFTIEEHGKVVRFLHVQIADKDQKPDFQFSYDVREFKGRDVTLKFKSYDEGVLNRLEFNNTEYRDPKAYDGPFRPQFHFSPRLGWMNDINGSYYQNGLYHIFYQSNPTYTNPSAGFDMHWGHSVSKDLIHWTEWPIALYPDSTGQCYSGTAVMIQTAIAGLTDGLTLPSPALMFAATEPFSQHLATTRDGGKSWQRFAGNPVLPNIGGGDRDPKVFWHEPSKHYIMIMYVDDHGYIFHRSTDLIHWERTSEIKNWYECPEFLKMKSPTTGEDLYVLYGNYNSPAGSGGISSPSAYQMGQFDGKVFSPIGPVRRAHQGPNFYAALTFVNEPKGRPIMMCWASGTNAPGEPFNQCAGIPLLLTLKGINGVDTLCFEPAREVNALRGKPILSLRNVTVAEARKSLDALSKEAPLDVTVRLRPASDGLITVRSREFILTYDPARKTLTRDNQVTDIHPGKSIDVRFLIDRSIVESFWNGGEAAYTAASLYTQNGPAFGIKGDAVIEELIVYPMSNIWKK
ncbi:MAG: glycoside hydrolase family 32 protein [Chthonomonadales bacterium]